MVRLGSVGDRVRNIYKYSMVMFIVFMFVVVKLRFLVKIDVFFLDLWFRGKEV